MGRFAIQSSLPKSNDNLNDSTRSLPSAENISNEPKPISRFKRASDDLLSDIPIKDPNSGGNYNYENNILDTKGRFQVSAILQQPAEKIQSLAKTTFPGIDSELLHSVLQDPMNGISQLSTEEKCTHILNHCNKQRVLIEQLISIIRQNGGDLPTKD